jgi:hypothetical protein
MKMKDWEGDLVGCQIIIPNYKKHNLPKRKMYIKSGWNKGLWLGIDDKQDGQIYPYFFEDFKEIENLEVIH